MHKVLVSILLVFCLSISHAADHSALPLSPNQAFQLTAEYNQPGLMILDWKIAPGYYLYRNKIQIELTSDSQVNIGPITLPVGLNNPHDATSTDQVYARHFVLTIPLLDVKKNHLQVTITYQGCAEKGFCYPPIHNVLTIDLADLAPPQDITPYLMTLHKPIKPAAVESEQATVEGIFSGHNYIFIMLSFLGLGLLLAFTPCVLPMVPILSGIIVGHGKHFTRSSQHT